MRPWLLALLLLGACAPRHAPPPWVTGYRIEGEHPHGPPLFGDPDLPSLDPDSRRSTARSGRMTASEAWGVTTHPLEQWWQFAPLMGLIAPRARLDEARLEEDAESVRAWFAEHGWLDATTRLQIDPAVGWGSPRLRARFEERHRRVRIVVNAGQRRTIGERRLVLTHPVTPELDAELRAALPEGGLPLLQSEVRHTTRALRQALGDAGHARADLDLQVADHGETADLSWTVTPGSPTHFGPVRLGGLDALSQQRLAHAMRLGHFEGDPFDLSRLQRAVEQLSFAPGIAGVDLTVDSSGTTPPTARIDVSELPKFDANPEVLVGSVGTVLAAQVGATAHARHLGGRPATLTVSGTAGYRLLGTGSLEEYFAGPNHGLMGTFAFDLRGVIDPRARTQAHLRADAVLSLERAHQVITPSVALGPLFQPHTNLTLDLSARTTGWFHFALPQQAALFETWFDPGSGSFAPTYQLTDLHLMAVWDRRRRVDTVPSGVHLELDLSPIGLEGGTRTWSRAELDARFFVPLNPRRYGLVGRVRAGAIAWHQGAPEVGRLGTQFHFSGSNDMRGYGYRRLTPPGWSQGLNDVQPGGNLLMMASLEGRWRMVPRVRFTHYIEAGRAWDRFRDSPTHEGFDLGDIQASAGIGAHIDTPLGIVGIYIASRLTTDPEIDPTAPQWTFDLVLPPEF